MSASFNRVFRVETTKPTKRQFESLHWTRKALVEARSQRDALSATLDAVKAQRPDPEEARVLIALRAARSAVARTIEARHDLDDAEANEKHALAFLDEVTRKVATATVGP